MHLTKNSSDFVIESKVYRLDLTKIPGTSYLMDKNSGRLFGFAAGGDCCKADGKDSASNSSEWHCLYRRRGEIFLSRQEDSVLWGKKEFFCRCTEDSLEFWHHLSGSGEIDEIRFFRQCVGNAKYGFAGDVDEVYSPAPNFREQNYFHPAERVIISHGDELSLHTGGHALASVPHVMALHDRRDSACLTCGIAVSPGEYLWDEFIWNPECVIPPTGYLGDAWLGGGFSIRYYGKKSIGGEWESPRLVILFSKNEKRVLEDFLDHCYRLRYLTRPAPIRRERWWNTPIYCTWHDQVAAALQDQPLCEASPDCIPGNFCTQKLADEWLEILIANHCRPGIVILDAKWQQSLAYADPDPGKWPDLRGWIERCHAQGIRVFLWNLAYHKEDISPEEAVLQNEEVLCGDITNPGYEKKFREMIRRYFSPAADSLNADGIKMDGFLSLPTGKNLSAYADIWGLELQKYYLSVLYDAVKSIKADACVSTFCAHPYLSPYSDMVRIADMYTWRLTPEHAMRKRFAVYQTTMPFALVDTDGQLAFHQAPGYADLLSYQTEIGIPSVYNAEYLRRARVFFSPVFSRLTPCDYHAISRSFTEFRKKSKVL